MSALCSRPVSIVTHRLPGFSSHMLLPLRDGEADSRQRSISLLYLTGGFESRRRRDGGIAMVGLCTDRQMTEIMPSGCQGAYSLSTDTEPLLWSYSVPESPLSWSSISPRFEFWLRLSKLIAQAITIIIYLTTGALGSTGPVWGQPLLGIERTRPGLTFEAVV